MIPGENRNRRTAIEMIVMKSLLRNFVGIIAVEDLIVKLSVLSVWIK